MHSVSGIAGSELGSKFYHLLQKDLEFQSQKECFLVTDPSKAVLTLVTKNQVATGAGSGVCSLL